MRYRWRGLLYGGILGCGLLAATRAWPTGVSDNTELNLRVWKARHEMWLEDGGRVLRKFEIALGKEPTAGKAIRGDGRTPEGNYYICEKRPQSRFRRFLGISYPNVDDAERAYAERLISADEWAEIFFANIQQTVPPWSTALGGRVGIHGYGGRPELPIDWTEGCIAVSDADIDYLYDRVPIGTRVTISE
ncbi:MAG: L,D-transpeptidase [Candidatus Binatia bacterium]